MTTRRVVTPNQQINTLTRRVEELAVRLGRVGRGRPGVAALRSGDQGVASGGYADVSFNSSDERDTHDFHDPAVNPERVTVPDGMGGRYRLTVQGRWDTDSTGVRVVRWVLSGTVQEEVDSRPPVSGHRTGFTATWEADLADGDWVSVQVLQTSGASLGLLGPIRLSVLRVSG